MSEPEPQTPDRRRHAPPRSAPSVPAGEDGQRASAMLSTAMVVSQHDSGGVVRRMTSASTAGADAALAMPTKSPGLLTVFCSVNAVLPLAMPVITNTTGVVLDDTSTD